jgi:hypothetical protein
MLVKSVMGYALAVMVAYSIWLVVARFFNEKTDKVQEEHKAF